MAISTPRPPAPTSACAFAFEDDGPSITRNEAIIPTLTTDDTDITDTAGPVSFATLFTTDFGADGFKDADDNDDEDADAIAYTLGIGAGASGLVDTLTADEVQLSLVGTDVVVGTVNGGADEVFRVSVDADTGAVTLTQSRSVVHDDPLDPDETGDLRREARRGRPDHADRDDHRWRSRHRAASRRHRPRLRLRG